jgi:hypothetical protein
MSKNKPESSRGKDHGHHNTERSVIPRRDADDRQNDKKEIEWVGYSNEE